MDASAPRWARIVGIDRRVGPLARIDLEVRYGWEPPVRYSAQNLVPRDIEPHVGQDVAIRKDAGTEATIYEIDWKRPPQYGKSRDEVERELRGAPEGEPHPIEQLVEAQRAYKAGEISEAELERAKEGLRGLG